jgi:hypothetical protein|tara:strand:+ start:875 stop:1069 length:195 start_codon:yes stop_codon:yes gene_type:complete
MVFSKIITLLNGKKFLGNSWDFLLFYRTAFLAGEDILIPVENVLNLHSPSIDGELFIDGEGFIS